MTTITVSLCAQRQRVALHHPAESSCRCSFGSAARPLTTGAGSWARRRGFSPHSPGSIKLDQFSTMHRRGPGRYLQDCQRSSVAFARFDNKVRAGPPRSKHFLPLACVMSSKSKPFHPYNLRQSNHDGVITPGRVVCRGFGDHGAAIIFSTRTGACFSSQVRLRLVSQISSFPRRAQQSRRHGQESPVQFQARATGVFIPVDVNFRVNWTDHRPERGFATRREVQ